LVIGGWGVSRRGASGWGASGWSAGGGSSSHDWRRSWAESWIQRWLCATSMSESLAGTEDERWRNYLSEGAG
jgi:hypothetical protein